MSFTYLQKLGRVIYSLAHNGNSHHHIAVGKKTAGWGGVNTKNLIAAEVGR